MPTYGVPKSVRIRENHPQEPVNPYGYGKLIAERGLRDYERAYGLRFISLRYFNAVGADPEDEIGGDHDPETQLIPLVLQTAADRRFYIVINGGDYPTPDGACVRDYIHVSDLADAHVLALRYLQEGGRSDCVNLGIGAGASMKTIIDLQS